MKVGLEYKVTSIQQQICLKYGVDFLPSPFNSIIGIATETFNDLVFPINGLRNPLEKEGYANWYVWAGEYSDAADFFKPMHVQHLIEIYPKAIDYLGLPAGWRFLFDNDYEDVWYDEKLLISSS